MLSLNYQSSVLEKEGEKILFLFKVLCIIGHSLLVFKTYPACCSALVLIYFTYLNMHSIFFYRLWILYFSFLLCPYNDRGRS